MITNRPEGFAYPVARRALLYTLGALASQASQAIVLMTALYLLEPQQVGLFSLAMSVYTFLSLLVSLGLRQIVVFDYYQVSGYKRAQLLGFIVMLYTYSIPVMSVVVLPFCFYFFLIMTPLSYLQVSFLVTLVTINAFAAFFSEGVYLIASYRAEISWLTFNRTIAHGITLVISSISLYLYESFYGLILAHLVGNLFIIIKARAWIKNPARLSFLPHKQFKKHVFRYLVRGFAFLPSLVSTWVLQISNRWVVAYYGTLQDVALYSLTDYVYVLCYTCLLSPLGATYVPAVLERFSYAKTEQDYKNIDNYNLKIMILCLAVLLMSSVLFYGWAEEIITFIFPSHYQGCLPLLYARFISVVFFLGTYFTTIVIQFMQKTRFLVWSLVITAALSLLLALVLTPYYGISGTLAGSLVAQCFYFAITLSYNRFLHKNLYKNFYCSAQNTTQNNHTDTLLYDELYTEDPYNIQQSKEDLVQL